MNLLKSPEGSVTAVLTSADPGWMIEKINEREIPLYHVKKTGELTVSFRCARNSQQSVSKLCEKYGSEVHFQENRDLGWCILSVLRHRVLVTGIIVLFLMTWYLPTRVLFIRVEGNVQIPSGQILDAAQSCGIHFGVSGKTVRSEHMKNALLEKIPELQWAGINTSGCMATILVRERETEKAQPRSAGVQSIAAVRDGYITSCTVTRGTGVCVPGQVVKAGQILISGYTDCGYCIRAEGAQGEVYGETNRNFRTIIPSSVLVRHQKRNIIRRCGIIIGKKQINLRKDSGISPGTCGRMYEEYYITLPGGFSLPLGYFRDTITHWNCDGIQVGSQNQESEWQSFAKRSVLEQTVAGHILRESHICTQMDDFILLESSFRCSEMIGRVIMQEIGDTNGEIN